MQSTDVFRPKNDNIKELETNRMASAKLTKTPKSAEQSSGGAKVSSGDMKTIQNNNKLNNNAIEAHHDDAHVDKNEVKIILSKPKNVVAPTTATATALAAAAVTTTGGAALMGTTKPTVADTKIPQKPNSGSNACDVANNKSNNNVTTINATAPKNPAKESTKKKSKEKDQKVAEEKRRQQEEEEERKRLELIAAQRKAKLVDQNAVRAEQGPKRNNLAASVGKCTVQYLFHTDRESFVILFGFCFFFVSSSSMVEFD